MKSVVQATLTEGAIGYRRFDVIAGEKAMAVIRLADGTMPPFGGDGAEPEKNAMWGSSATPAACT
ncbi:Outer membrane usher protein papC precursor [Serratia fonticola]|uniref:Outer membrane usher protein papC n=1 Tax=Serratia fonticola TaxID=47917 RepID=A0A4V6KTR1_SERFO|nr:Outer membrane usher protein papC precursor [Serratia fonticola]